MSVRRGSSHKRVAQLIALVRLESFTARPFGSPSFLAEKSMLLKTPQEKIGECDRLRRHHGQTDSRNGERESASYKICKTR